MTPSPVLFSAAAALTIAAPASVSAGDLALDRGRHIAERDCAACHAVGSENESPNGAAPTFRAIRLRYNPISLEHRLGPMPRLGHARMPPRTLNAADIPDLVAYIQSLGPRP